MRFSRWSRLTAAALLGLFSITALAGYKAPTPPPPEQQAQAKKLAAYYWDLSKALDSSGQLQTQWEIQGLPAARLTFDKKGNAYSTHTCNGVPLAYTLQGTDRVTFKPNGGVTLMGCSDGSEWRQNQIYSQISKAKSYRLENQGNGDAPRLTLYFLDGSRWEFAGLATPETRYGSPGKRMQLEIAVDLVPCQTGTGQCMNARPVRWEMNTLQSCLGDWQVLTDGIEGYKHTPGRHEIVAVDAYPLTKRPSKGPSNVYVMQWTVVSVIPSLKKLPDCPVNSR